MRWVKLRLGDVCKKIGSGATPRGGSNVYLDSGPVSFIRSQNIYNERFSYQGLVFIDEDTATTLQNVQVEEKDILLNITGDSVARACQVPNTILPARVNQHVAIIRTDHNQLSPTYLRYFLNSPEMQAHMLALAAAGATRNALTKGMIEDFEIECPASVVNQESVTIILKNLDKKTELNRKTNETLEAMARTLFQAWFVDFEPVWAKMEGRWKRGQSLPGLPAHLYDLFPDRLVEAELGNIPDGWHISTIGDEVSVYGGGTPSTKEPTFWQGGIHCWATPKDLSSLKAPVLMDTERKLTDQGLSKIGSGLLPRGTVLLSSRAPIGYLAITEMRTAVNQGFIAMVCSKTITNLFALFWCHANMDAIVGRANGSTFQEISKSNFRQIPVITPSPAVMDSFQKIASPIYSQLVENEKESDSLTQLRDTLLPRLLSGELRVPEAERLAEEVL